MKLYDFGRAPNPRRARIFVAEKGIDDIEIVQVDLGKLEQRGDEYRSLNPSCTVPALLLDDGTLITESIAICRYFEELQPLPPLMGRNAIEKAQVEISVEGVNGLGYKEVTAIAENVLAAYPLGNYLSQMMKPFEESIKKIP